MKNGVYNEQEFSAHVECSKSNLAFSISMKSAGKASLSVCLSVCPPTNNTHIAIRNNTQLNILGIGKNSPKF